MIIDICIILLFFLLRIPLPSIVTFIPISHLLYRFIADIIFMLLLFILLKSKKQSIATNIAGWKKIQFHHILLGILGAVILFTLSLSIIQFVPQKQIYNYDFTLYPIRIYILLLVTSTTEELFYRGFILQKLTTHGKLGAVSATLLASFLFSLGHIYLGMGGIIFSFLSGIILAFIVLKYQSITSSIIAHILYNIIFYTMHLYDSSI